MKPQTELAQGPSPVLDHNQVEHLVSPISQVMIHCLMYHLHNVYITVCFLATNDSYTSVNILHLVVQ